MSDRDKVLGHSDESDGIEEYDNKLPAWWLGLFFFSVVFGVVYAADYHFVSERSYAKELDAAILSRPKPKVAVASVAMAGPADPEAGKAIFTQNCVACHGADLKGGVGPDLTDAVWIHGGTLANITNVITVGVPEKGMLTWGPILGAEKISQVAAYVHAAGGGQ
jgi:cytochrome c oxidase cbb3-type subunit 3